MNIFYPVIKEECLEWWIMKKIDKPIICNYSRYSRIEGMIFDEIGKKYLIADKETGNKWIVEIVDNFYEKTPEVEYEVSVKIISSNTKEECLDEWGSVDGFCEKNNVMVYLLENEKPDLKSKDMKKAIILEDL